MSCPNSVRMTPFAVGPLDARRRDLAEAVARCAYARRYFARLSPRGDAEGAMCGTTDGAQGHAIGECVSRLAVADGTARRIHTGHCVPGSGRCSERAGSPIAVHPLKKRDLPYWNASWHTLTRFGYAPAPLVESIVDLIGPTRPVPTVPPRVKFVSERHGHANVFGDGTPTADVWKQRLRRGGERAAARPAGRRLATPVRTSRNCSAFWHRAGALRPPASHRRRLQQPG